VTNAQYNQKLTAYGPIAVCLDEYDTMLNDENVDWWPAVEEFYEYTRSADCQPVIIKLAQDGSVVVRALAARIITILWDATRMSRPKPERRKMAQDLAWTMPLLERLMYDRSASVVIDALAFAWRYDNDLIDAPPQLRQAAIDVASHKSADVRLKVVQVLNDFYPSDDEALGILDEPAKAVYLKVFEDSSKDIRDWAYFKVRQFKEPDERFAAGLLKGVAAEHPLSDAYMEAVISAAAMGLELDMIEQIIVDNVNDPDCGRDWVDALEYCKTAECAEAAVAWYSREVQTGANTVLLDKLERLFYDYNDPL